MEVQSCVLDRFAVVFVCSKLSSMLCALDTPCISHKYDAPSAYTIESVAAPNPHLWQVSCPSPRPCHVTPVIHTSTDATVSTNSPNPDALGAVRKYSPSSHSRVLSAPPATCMSSSSAMIRHWPGSKSRRGAWLAGGVKVGTPSWQFPCTSAASVAI